MGTKPALAVRNVVRRFGGLRAVDGVSLELRQSSIHALIGTNGAGKSTLLNLMAGDLPISSGNIEYFGAECSAWTQPQRARAGLGRTYQRTSVFPGLSVLQNCQLAAQADAARWRDWLRAGTTCPHSRGLAEEAVARAGLEAHASHLADTLPHGRKRQLELAICLATRPRVLLLDEPLAGLGADESERMLTLLEQLRREHAVLLVEHDMEAVFRVADEVTVMVNGQCIASGDPHAIRRDTRVQEAYLGAASEEADAH